MYAVSLVTQKTSCKDFKKNWVVPKILHICHWRHVKCTILTHHTITSLEVTKIALCAAIFSMVYIKIKIKTEICVFCVQIQFLPPYNGYEIIIWTLCETIMKLVVLNETCSITIKVNRQSNEIRHSKIIQITFLQEMIRIGQREYSWYFTKWWRFRLQLKIIITSWLKQRNKTAPLKKHFAFMHFF